MDKFTFRKGVVGLLIAGGLAGIYINETSANKIINEHKI
jgi:hypothetical protein